MIRAFVLLLAAVACVGLPAAANGSGLSGPFAHARSAPQYDPARNYKKGVELYRAGKYSKAEKAFKRVSRVAKDNPNAHYMLGLSRFRQKEYQSATTAFEQAVHHNLALFNARGKLGLCYIEMKEPNLAKDVLADLRRASAECSETCSESGQIASAIIEIESALAEGRENRNSSMETKSFTRD